MRLVHRLGYACALLGLAAPSAANAAPSASPVPGISSAGDAITKAPDGSMWLTEPAAPGRIAHVTTGGSATELKGGVTANLPANLAPSDIATTANGTAWFLASGSSTEWGSISPDGTTVTRYNLLFDLPTSLVTGSDGMLWMTTDSQLWTGSDAIVRYNPATNEATSFSGGLNWQSQPRSIAAGADGALWFVEGSTGRVGRITTAGSLSFRSVGGAPSALGASAGTTWFARGTQLGAIGANDTTTLFPSATTPTAIAEGADGATWSAGTGGLVRVEADGTTSLHTAGLDPAAKGNGLAAGADGRLWMTLDRAPFLVRITVPPRLTAATSNATGPTGANVTATVQPNGITTVARLELRQGDGSWTSLSETAVGDGTAPAPVSFTVDGLTAGAVNTLRVVAVNDAGVQSQTTEVTTPAAEPEPVPTTPEPTTPDPTTPTTPEPTTPEPTTPEPTTPEPTTPEPTTPEPTTPVPTTPEATTPVTTTPGVPMSEDEDEKEDEPSTPEATTPEPTTPEPSTPEPIEPTTPEPAATTPPAIPTPPVAPAATPEPVQGASVVVAPERGVVKFRVPGSTIFREVTDAASIPTGSTVDATKGAIVLTSQVGNKLQEGTFSGGEFRVGQNKATGMTQIKLSERLGCPTDQASSSKRATKAAKKKAKKRRHVWGQDNGGAYETHGRDSVATVRGTKWLTTDTCEGTVVKVFEGAVSVQPKAGGKPTLVKVGGRHFAPHVS